MNTSTYKQTANSMPLECAGMFSIPEHSSNSIFSGMSETHPLGLVPRGFDLSAKKPTFHHIPLAVECQKNNSPQQPRGFQRVQVLNIPEIPHTQPLYAPHSFFEQCHGHPLPA